MMLPPGRSPGARLVRMGAPFDASRLLRLLQKRRTLLITIGVLAAVVGAITGKWLIVKTYAATSVLLWEPPATARADAVREISTLVDSVKLPGNLQRVRDRVGYSGRLEQLARQIEVTTGDNSMLITVTARASTKQGAADLTNAMVDVFLHSQKKVSEARLQETAQALRASLSQSQKALDEARQKYDGFRRDNHIGDLSIEMQAAIEEVARLRVAANDARVELQSSGAEEDVLRQKRSSLAPTIEGPNPEQQRAEAARLGQAEAELADARAKYTDEHPKVKLLAGEVGRLKSHLGEAGRNPAKVTMRNPALSSVGTRLEQSALARRTAEERRKALTDVIQEAEQHAAKLTAVQGQAANLLADVTVAQDHVAATLKQLATAEDDVRQASSYFQIVSRANLPEHSEKGLGKIVAISTPFAALLLTFLMLFKREMRDLVVRTASEASYWSGAPVLWSSAWPSGSEDEMRELSREMANVLELRPAVVGLTVLGGEADEDLAALVAAASQDRLVSRGETSAVTDLRQRLPTTSSADLADALEHRSVGEELGDLRLTTSTVLAILPSMRHPAAVRAVLRWIDALVVVVPSGRVRFTKLMALRQTLGLHDHGLGLVMVDMPEDLLATTARTAAAAPSFWPPARPRRRASMIHPRLSDGTGSSGASALVTLPGVPPR